MEGEKVRELGPEPDFDTMMNDLRAGRMLRIFVGEDPKPYMLQESIITSQYDLPVFNSALRAGYAEGQTGVLRFPEDDPDAWRLLLYWIMAGHLPSSQIQHTEEGLYTMLHAWLLGDKYDVIHFRNCIMAELMWCFQDHSVTPEIVDL